MKQSLENYLHDRRAGGLHGGVDIHRFPALFVPLAPSACTHVGGTV